MCFRTIEAFITLELNYKFHSRCRQLPPAMSQPISTPGNLHRLPTNISRKHRLAFKCYFHNFFVNLTNCTSSSNRLITSLQFDHRVTCFCRSFEHILRHPNSSGQQEKPQWTFVVLLGLHKRIKFVQHDSIKIADRNKLSSWHSRVINHQHRFSSLILLSNSHAVPWWGNF